jgi:tetratricopeptide (TPR) repeat protein
MLDVASDRSAALNAKAQILTEWLGRDEEALELSLQAAGLRPDDESIAANLAEMQLKIGRYPEARETAQRVLDRTDEATNRCAMLFVVWAAHVLEDSESGARARAFAEFVEFLHGHYVAGPGRRVTWSYRGLKRALGERGTSAESRFLLDAAIDVQEGKLRARDMSFFAEHEQLVQLPDA